MNFIGLNRGLWRSRSQSHKLRLWQRSSQLTLHFYIILLCFTVHFSFSNYLPLKDSWNYLVHHFQYACFLHDFSGHTVNLIQKSKGRDDFLNFILSVCVYIFFSVIQQQTQLAGGGWANTCISEKVFLESESRVETSYYSSIIFGSQQKIKTHVYIYSFVTHKNSLTKANYFLAVKTILDLLWFFF